MKKHIRCITTLGVIACLAVPTVAMGATDELDDKTFTYTLTAVKSDAAPSATAKTHYGIYSGKSATRKTELTFKYKKDGKTYTKTDTQTASSTSYQTGSSTATVSLAAPSNRYSFASASSTHRGYTNGTRIVRYLTK